MTYLNESDERFNNIDNIDLSYINNFYVRQNHLLQYLIYGYKDSEGREILSYGW